MLIVIQILHLKTVPIFTTSYEGLFIRWKLWVSQAVLLVCLKVSEGQASDWLPILVGILQGSILGLLIFTINNLPRYS